jgi:hypothetical protein
MVDLTDADARKDIEEALGKSFHVAVFDDDALAIAFGEMEESEPRPPRRRRAQRRTTTSPPEDRKSKGGLLDPEVRSK